MLRRHAIHAGCIILFGPAAPPHRRVTTFESKFNYFLEHYYVSTYERARNGIINQPLLLMSLLLDYNAPRSFAHKDTLSTSHTPNEWVEQQQIQCHTTGRFVTQYKWKCKTVKCREVGLYGLWSDEQTSLGPGWKGSVSVRPKFVHYRRTMVNGDDVGGGW